MNVYLRREMYVEEHSSVVTPTLHRPQTAKSLQKILDPEKALLQRFLVMPPREDGSIFDSLSQTRERYYAV